MNHQGYYERALKADDKRYARIFEKMGYRTRAMQAAPVATPVVVVTDEDELKALRDQYQEKVGKRAYHAWTADELREKIAAAGEPDDGEPAAGEDE